MTHILILVIIGTIMIFPFFQFASSVEDNSSRDLKSEIRNVVGRFFHSEPPKDDRIFLIHHSVVNGSLVEITQNIRDAGIKFNITSTTTGSFHVDIPRNYPHSNQPWFEPFVIINGEEMNKDTDYILEKEVCFYKFTIFFSGDSLMEIAFAHVPEQVPFISEEIPATCTEKTITSNPPPLDLSYMSPLDQFNSGIKLNHIQCKFNLYLVERINGKPACVESDTKSILLERGLVKPT